MNADRPDHGASAPSVSVTRSPANHVRPYSSGRCPIRVHVHAHAAQDRRAGAQPQLRGERRVGGLGRDLGARAGVVVDPVGGEGGRHRPGVAQGLEHVGQAFGRKDGPEQRDGHLVGQAQALVDMHPRALRKVPAPRPLAGWRRGSAASGPLFRHAPRGQQVLVEPHAPADRVGHLPVLHEDARPAPRMHRARPPTGRPARGARCGGSRRSARQAAPRSAGGRRGRNAPWRFHRRGGRGSRSRARVVPRCHQSFMCRACVEAGPRRISLYSCINKWTTAQDVEFGDERDGKGNGPGGRKRGARACRRWPPRRRRGSRRSGRTGWQARGARPMTCCARPRSAR
jgi:hypothetical protein